MGSTAERAFDAMSRRPERYDPTWVEKVRAAMLGAPGAPVKTASFEVRIKEMLVGDVLLNDVETLDGRKLLSAGTRLSSPFLERLHNYRRLVGVQEPISVLRRVSGAGG